MNDLNIEELANEWKEIDMEVIALAMDTGRLQTWNRLSFLFMAVLQLAITCFTASLVLALMKALESPVSLHPLLWVSLLVTLSFSGAYTLFFGWFFRRQILSSRAAEALLTGDPSSVIRGRIGLLELERFAWDSRPIRAMLAVVVPLLFAALVFGVYLGIPWWFAAAVVVTFAAFGAYGLLIRVPKLDADMAELARLASALESQ